MALQFTPYLGMEYNQNGDVAFRASYNNAMDMFDDIAVAQYALDGDRVVGTSQALRMKFPINREYHFDDSIFTPTANFEIIPGTNRILHLGEKVYFEVQLKLLVAIGGTTNGNIGNIVLGSFSSQYPRRFGEYIMSINETAAAYGFGSNNVQICALGGMTQSISLPIGTELAFGGSFTI